jgi:protein SCO1/2
VKEIAALRLQDHSGSSLTFADVFHGRPSIVVFFYTRCDNPTKCPLTMYRFGSLQRLLVRSGLGHAIGMAAITYDPEYDCAERLLQYAQSWGVVPSAVHRILRTVDDFAAVRDYFALGVNFSASGIVNRHQLEAFVLDPHGRIVNAVTRRRWDEGELMASAARLLKTGRLLKEPAT